MTRSRPSGGDPTARARRRPRFCKKTPPEAVNRTRRPKFPVHMDLTVIRKNFGGLREKTPRRSAPLLLSPPLPCSRAPPTSPPPPTLTVASALLPAQIEGNGGLRRRLFSLLPADRSPGRRDIAGIAAAASAALRRLCTPPRPLRRPISGGAATFGEPASGRIRQAHARAPARAGSSPAWLTRPRRLRPPTTPR